MTITITASGAWQVVAPTQQLISYLTSYATPFYVQGNTVWVAVYECPWLDRLFQSAKENK